MSDIRNTASLLDGILAGKKTEKYSYTLSQSEKQELNLEDGAFKLFRTVFNNSGSLKIFAGDRMGVVGCNDISEEGLRKLVEDGITAAESAEEDSCHDIAPDQGKEVFRQGVSEPDMDRFLERTKEFLDTVARDYPKVKIMSAISSFDRWHWISRNTNGTEFEGFGGRYSFSLEISASDGEATTGLDYTWFCTDDLDTPFIEISDVRKHLEDIQESIHPKALEGKFTGTVILTPGCAENFIQMLLSNYVRDGVIIDGTSQWLDKVGQKVADASLTVRLDPFDERITMGERGTQNGFLAEAVTVIDKGVLNTHILSLYAANKTGRPVVKNTGSDLVVEAGNSSLEELIASIDHGLILGGFSGGSPGTNGEFSGVAKNSFLIENGKVQYAVTETMVNGNLGEAFCHIRGISDTQRCDGSGVIPYIAIDGIVISGK
ncbi:MAG: TldD/PmbA family protein [Butyrivibrio sp.]|nr:TldD/PmbA family protein [Butyrivibrio sp.]